MHEGAIEMESMTMEEAIATVVDLWRQNALCLQDVCTLEEWDRFGSAMQTLSGEVQ